MYAYSTRGLKMKCQQPDVRTPVDFTGDSLNIQVELSPAGCRVWVCIDDVSVFRAKNLKHITMGGLQMSQIVDIVGKHLDE